MKFLSDISKAVFLTTLVLVASSTFAASKGPLNLQHDTNVAGKALQTGTYTVSWEGTGDQVELKIFKGKNLIMSVPASVIQLSSSPENDSAVVSQGSDGTRSLSQIRFSGKKSALQIGGAGTASGSAGASK